MSTSRQRATKDSMQGQSKAHLLAQSYCCESSHSAPSQSVSSCEIALSHSFSSLPEGEEKKKFNVIPPSPLHPSSYLDDLLVLVVLQEIVHSF